MCKLILILASLSIVLSSCAIIDEGEIDYARTISGNATLSSKGGVCDKAPYQLSTSSASGFTRDCYETLYRKYTSVPEIKEGENISVHLMQGFITGSSEWRSPQEFFQGRAPNAELVIIGNLENNIAAPMTKKQVQELFMGRARFFSNGLRAVPLDVSDLRSSFYQRLTNRPIEQINAYWARLTFSGHSVPPAVLENQQAIINAVKQSKGGIAYIEGDNIDDSQVKLLLEIK